MNLDALLGRPVAYVLRHLAVAIPVCTFIALFLSVVFGEPLTQMLAFSFSIGLVTQALIDGLLRLAARLQPAAGSSAPVTRRGWPGWGWALPIIVVGLLGGIQLGYPIAGWLLGIEARPPDLGNWRSWFVILSVCLIASLAVTGWFWARGRLATADALRERAQRAAAENQLKLLEAQLEPHMLFNTLANLRVLIGLDPVRAQAMLDRLIAFLRATLQASRTGAHRLDAEFERLADYLALMQVRMGERMRYDFDLPDDLRAVAVPPLLLQPLVENAIRHGLEPKRDGGRIDIAARRDGARLVLTVRDTGVGLGAAAAPSGTRFGMRQVQERLAALHGAQARLTLEPGTDGGAVATITLPLS